MSAPSIYNLIIDRIEALMKEVPLAQEERNARGTLRFKYAWKRALAEAFAENAPMDAELLVSKVLHCNLHFYAAHYQPYKPDETLNSWEDRVGADGVNDCLNRMRQSEPRGETLVEVGKFGSKHSRSSDLN